MSEARERASGSCQSDIQGSHLRRIDEVIIANSEKRNAKGDGSQVNKIRKRRRRKTDLVWVQSTAYRSCEPNPRHAEDNLKRQWQSQAELMGDLPTEPTPTRSATDQETSQRCASRSGFMSQRILWSDQRPNAPNTMRHPRMCFKS
ncbi:hypothetical protein DOTSEDRAFT_78965 [Dothistroma septosporum NZE10]|uniref:Uncharacterized protein n=1 Tax=Dothistroma septosporum (strain NZE10 / CBS 128990) TaxID=675120 RepID=N1PTX4_DOTSN|nr:hypothetical protein DOTSEDRAFT_78965 [Dothistroma septosporum NZE10]